MVALQRSYDSAREAAGLETEVAKADGAREVARLKSLLEEARHARCLATSHTVTLPRDLCHAGPAAEAPSALAALPSGSSRHTVPAERCLQTAAAE